jgi:hypothetical protein
MLKKNLILFKQRFPDIEEKLSNTPINSFTLCETRKGEANLKYELNGKTIYIHSNYSAAKETKKWISSLDLSNTQVLEIYGIGLGYSFFELKSWLEDASHHLVFFENDLAIFEALLKMPYAEEIIKHPRVTIRFFGENPDQDALSIEEFSLFYNFLEKKITALPHNSIFKNDSFCLIRDSIVKSAIRVHQVQPEFLFFGVSYLLNFYSTILSLEKSHIGEKLHNAFPNFPAIICGAGPSLKKNAHILKTLQEKAIIFAPGSSISALGKYGIEPHFGGSADSSPGQYGRMINHQHYEMPVIYKSRINQQAYHALHQGVLIRKI